MGTLQQHAAKTRRLRQNVKESTKQKDDDDPPNPARTRFRRGEMYMDDGNVEFIAEDAVIFRVHKGLLVLRSTVFRDMFAARANEVVDGGLVIRMTDTAEQLGCLLKVIYENPGEFSPALGLKPLLHIALLGHNYAIDNRELSDRALKELRPFFPDSFKTWTLCVGITPEQREAFAVEDLLYAIQVALVVNSCTILAIAYFLLSSQRLDELVARVPHNDGLARILNGRETLTGLAWAYISPVVFRSIVLPHDRACLAVRDTWAENLRQISITGIFNWRRNPQAPLQAQNLLTRVALVFAAAAENRCDTCKEKLRADGNRLLEHIWEKIPSAFGLLFTDAEKAKWSATEVTHAD